MPPDIAAASPASAASLDTVAPLHTAVTIGFADGIRRRIERRTAAETPIQVLFSDIPFGVMMATPADLEDFAYGFSLTEGVIDAPEQIRAVRIREAEDGIRLDIDLVAARLQAHLGRRRAMTGRTSCGLCGIEDLSALPRATGPRGPAPVVALAALQKALAALDAGQSLNAATRSVHGAAWAAADGTILDVREDVGRHNALDKLIGARFRAEPAPSSGFVVVTSRASFEMVEKAAAFGARTLVAISAPTGLAIARARALDLTLIGIARHDSVTAFHGGSRIVGEGSASGTRSSQPPVANPG